MGVSPVLFCLKKCTGETPMPPNSKIPNAIFLNEIYFISVHQWLTFP